MTHVLSFVFHSLFLCQLHAHTYANQNVLAETFFVVSREMQCLHNFVFVGPRSFISLPSFMFVSTAVSEIRESNRNKKKKNLQNEHLSQVYNN